jgi:hypothetical protein
VPAGQGNGPCVTGQWLVAATRVFSNGQPLVLLDSQAICTPNGTPHDAGDGPVARDRELNMSAYQLHFPYQIDGRGRSAEADEATYIRGLIEQVLFTLAR